MIEPELGSNGKRFSPALALGGRQKNFLLHADMPEESCTELGVGVVIDRSWTSSCRLQQSVKTSMVFD